MRSVKTVFAAALIASLFATVARADKDETTIFKVKAPYVEIEVGIDNALKAYPRLYDSLVAEGKQFGIDNKKDTVEQWREDKTLFHHPYTFSRSYRLRTTAGKYVSVAIDESFYTGGAHPNSDTDTLLWDRESGSRADFKTLFADTTDNGPAMTSLAKLIRAAVAAEKKRRDIEVGDPDTDEWLKEVKAEFKTFGAPSLAPSTTAGKSSGITFHFSPYAVGPYVEGFFNAFIPAEALAPYLTADAQKLFGGARPKSDEAE